jgi:benzylsuccinate CoA-transferase BbsF subunit
VTDPANEPPLKAGGYQAGYLSGWTAAAATMVALHHRRALGRGQMVDIDQMECVANMLRYSFGAISYHPEAVATRLKFLFSWILPCKNGHVSFLPFQDDHWWRDYIELMGNPEWADTELFSGLIGRCMNADAIEPRIIEWMRDYTKEELYSMALENGLPGFPVNSIRDVHTSEQYAHRLFFVDVDHAACEGLRQPGAFCQFSATPINVSKGAPRLGEHNAALLSQEDRWRARDESARPSLASERVEKKRPLEGIRVAEFGWALAVPLATCLLAAAGAEVIRVESNRRLDIVRSTPTGCAEGVPGPNRSSFFNGLNFGKKSITLNLATPEGLALAKELIGRCDIVASNFSVGVLDKLGLGNEDLLGVKPDLIVLTGSPLGGSGPESSARGFGPNTQCYAGLPYITGYQGGGPCGLGGNWPDYAVGLSMAFSLMAALDCRRRTGKGQILDVSMAEVVSCMIPEALLEFSMNSRETQRAGNTDPRMCPHGVYPCEGDDKWVAIAVKDDAKWLRFKEAMGGPAWACDPTLEQLSARMARREELDARIAEWTREHTHYDVMHHLQQSGVAAAPCLDAAELRSDPHLVQRGFLREMDHEEVGSRLMPGLPARYSEPGVYSYGMAPLLGEHNEDILCGLLGLSRARFDELSASKVID